MAECLFLLCRYLSTFVPGLNEACFKHNRFSCILEEAIHDNFSLCGIYVQVGVYRMQQLPLHK